ncbi:TGFB1 factor, partial [Urocolius indicus]|nr:TGFB1 factor [Urocolius indicus]
QGFSNSSWHFLHGRWVEATATDEWLWFDVTQPVQQWLSSSEPFGSFKLSVHCPCDGGNASAMAVTIEGGRREGMRGQAWRHGDRPGDT